MRVTRVLVAVTVAVFAVTVTAACSGTAPAPDADSTSYTQAQLQRREDYLAELAITLGLEDPPAVQLIRFVGSEEWATAQISCLNDVGFPVVLMSDGEGIDPSAVPESQRQPGGALNTAIYECEAKFTSAVAISDGLSDWQLAQLYEWYVSESVPCLESQGVAVGVAPSEQKFIETYFTSDGWFPYGFVNAETMPIDEWQALNAICPQSPPDSLLGI